MTEIVAYLHGVLMIAIVLLTVNLITLLTKMGRNLAYTPHSLATICVTVLKIGTNATTSPAVTAMTSLSQGP